MLDVYLCAISNRMNEVMRVLTVLASMFVLATFVVGIQGMTLENMPEPSWRYGYFGMG